jgi:hypothetical protein
MKHDYETKYVDFGAPILEIKPRRFSVHNL